MRSLRFLFVLFMASFSASLRTEAEHTTNVAPFKHVWGHAYHVLADTHNKESGYSSLCEGLNGNIYVGTTKYGKNSTWWNLIRPLRNNEL
jgi:hypothetical protein